MLAGKPSAADKRKAEYAFMEAISKKEAGDIDAAYALLRHAVTLDPDNPTINYYVGFTMLNLDWTTDEEVDSATALMRINTIERPGDYYENYIYAILNASLSNHAEATRVLENLAKDIQQRPSCSLCSQKVMRHKATSTRPSPLSTAWRRLRDGR